MNKQHFKKNNKIHINTQSGVASIFVVIFFALLLGVITVSFVRIVNQDQQQALNNDLSQSAYDAAKAGVVDANRAIAICNGHSGQAKTDCLAQFENKCSDLSSFGNSYGLGLQKIGDTEVRVGSASDEKLNQSYTCAKIQYVTPSITLSLSNQKMRIIELKSDQPLNTIGIKWFNTKDAGTNPGTNIAFPTPGFPKLATDSSSWGGQATPPLLRVQFLQSNADGKFDLTNLSNSAKTTFLYPISSSPLATDKVALMVDSRGGVKSLQPSRAQCTNAKFTSNQLACEAELIIPATVPGQKAYLIIEPIYNAATVQVSASDSTSGTTAQLQGYPTIDVTGRAGDLFRRIKTTIDANSSPNTSVGGDDAPGFDSTKTFCKNFSVGREYHASTVVQCNN